jgi:hypothetical protein
VGVRTPRDTISFSYIYIYIYIYYFSLGMSIYACKGLNTSKRPVHSGSRNILIMKKNGFWHTLPLVGVCM